MSGRRAAYFRAYRSILLAAGGIGILLPVGLVFGDWQFLDAPFELRGSVSSYYYSPLRDLFVGSLCVIGVRLITYEWPGIDGVKEWIRDLSAEWKRIVEFGASSLAGLLLLVVAFCPTDPPGLAEGTHCKDTPKPDPCTILQHHFGESTLSYWHIRAAITALCLLFVVGILFAVRARLDTPRHRRLAIAHATCSAIIAVGLVVAGIGISNWNPSPIGPFAWLYSGEVVALLGFGFGWMIRGVFLTPLPDPPAPG